MAKQQGSISNSGVDKSKSGFDWLVDKLDPYGWAVFGMAGTWLFIMSYVQGGGAKVWDSLVYFYAPVFIIAFATGVLDVFKGRPYLKISIVLLAVVLYALYATGSLTSYWQLMWDGLGIALGILAWLFLRCLPWFRTALASDAANATKGQLGKSMLWLILFAWIGVSVVAVLRPSLLSTNPSRYASLGANNTSIIKQPSTHENLRVGLALSGGGYRAAVFHAGTLHALESLGIRADNLSTVSGGSIIGAYYSNGGDPVEFKNAVAEGRFNLKRELLLIHNAIHLICPMRVPLFDVELIPACNYSRLDVQASMLDRLLFENADHVENSNGPRLIINAADLTYGFIVGMLPNGVLMESTDRSVDLYQGEAFAPVLDLSLSQRVAISGAFPLAFPSTSYGLRVDSPRGTGDGTRPLHLVDGGVADNTGFRTLANANLRACKESDCPRQFALAADWYSDVILVSDGGAIFGVESDLGMLAQLSRAIDIGGARGVTRNQKLKGTPTIQLSAQDRFRSPGSQFQIYRDPEPGHEYKAPATHISFDIREHYPDFIVEKIISLLDQDKYPSLRHLRGKYREASEQGGPVDTRHWAKYISRVPNEDYDACLRRVESGPQSATLQTLPGICEAAFIRKVVSLEMNSLLKAFRETSTLDDQFGPKRAEELFRLGQFIVYLSWHDIDQAFPQIAARFSQ